MRDVLVFLEGGVLLLMGVGLVAAGVSVFIRAGRLRNHGVPVVGTVMESGTDDDNDAWVLIAYHFAGSDYLYRASYLNKRVGATVSLLVNPERPTEAGLPSFARGCAVPVLCVVCGSVIALYGGGILRQLFATDAKPSPTEMQYRIGRDASGNVSISFPPPADRPGQGQPRVATNPALP